MLHKLRGKKESCDQTYFISNIGDELSLNDCKIKRNSGPTYTSSRITAETELAQESHFKYENISWICIVVKITLYSPTNKFAAKNARERKREVTETIVSFKT
jgi:hypothetical protein